MGKVILAVDLCLDGYLEGPAGELDWWTAGPAPRSSFVQLAGTGGR